jgi:hypothetical protein
LIAPKSAFPYILPTKPFSQSPGEEKHLSVVVVVVVVVVQEKKMMKKKKQQQQQQLKPTAPTHSPNKNPL